MHTPDSDSEPEEVNVKSSKELAKQLFINERKAIQSLINDKKLKRKLDNNRYIQQKEAKRNNNIEKLSQNLLDEINIDRQETNEKTKDSNGGEGNQKKSKIRDRRVCLETESTHFDVIDINNDLPKLAQNKFNNEKKNVLNFKDKMIYNNRRHKRVGSSTMNSNFVKQSFISK